MNNDIREQFFDNLWAEHPNGNVKTVGWGSEESQELRFKRLASIVFNNDFYGKTILDVGCGLGDLFKYILGVSIIHDKHMENVGCVLSPQTYIGIDMMDKTIEKARKKYIDCSRAFFVSGNFLEHNFENVLFDYVFASGIFSIKTDDWTENTIAVMDKMFGLCKTGMAVNFLSDIHQNKISTSQYVDPATILTLCMSKFTPWVNVIHDYRTNDFTVHLYKEQQE